MSTYGLDLITDMIDITASTVSMIDASATHSIDAVSVTYGSFYSYSVTTSTTQTITDATFVNLTTSWETNIHSPTSDLLLTGVLPNSNFTFSPDVACSTTGETITYSISAYEDEEIPSWITFDSNTGQLTGTAPDDFTPTYYSFYLDASWTTHTAGSTQQKITIRVAQETTEYQHAVIVGFTVAAVSTVFLTIIASCCYLSHPIGIWAIVGQLQTIILI